MEKFDLPHDHGENDDFENIPAQFERIEDFKRSAEIFKQLCDPTRIRIFWLLCHCEECVTNISALLDMSCPAVSHHLRQLRNTGLIVYRRAGKEVYYKAADTEVAQYLHLIIERVMDISCPW